MPPKRSNYCVKVGNNKVTANQAMQAMEKMKANRRGSLGYYLCDFCNENVTGHTRFKCLVCSAELCKKCFMEKDLVPHTHQHNVQAHRSFSIKDSITSFRFSNMDSTARNTEEYQCLVEASPTPEWNIEEDLRLLEALANYGLNKWISVSLYVQTKCDSKCRRRYESLYSTASFSTQEEINRAELTINLVGSVDDQHIMKLKSLVTEPFWALLPEEKKALCRTYHLLVQHMDVADHITLLKRIIEHENLKKSIPAIMDAKAHLAKANIQITQASIEHCIRVKEGLQAAMQQT